MDELFAPPDYEWQRLSPNFRKLRRLTTLLVAPIIFTIPAVIVGVVSGLWWISAIIWGFAAVIVIIRLVLVGRTYRSWGYVEREDDLYITHGVLFRSLVAVPYGRMQLVEVESGPLERAFGIATVSLKTASVETNATIPGLPPEEAARLRDRLTEAALAGQSDGTVTANVDATEISGEIMAAGIGYAYMWIVAPEEIDLESILRRWRDRLANTLRPGRPTSSR